MSTVAKGNYYRLKTKKFYEAEGYEVVTSEIRKPMPIKRQADLDKRGYVCQRLDRDERQGCAVYPSQSQPARCTKRDKGV